MNKKGSENMLKKNEDFKEELQTQYTILIKAEERQQKKRTITLILNCQYLLLFHGQSVLINLRNMNLINIRS